MSGLRGAALIRQCSALPSARRPTWPPARYTLRRLAQRIQALTAEARELQRQITPILQVHALDVCKTTASAPTTPPPY